MVIARFRSFLGKVSALNGVRNIFSSSRTTETPVRGSSHDEAARLLFKRISPLGDPTVSLAPVLDQWVHEGHELHRSNLTSIIKELRSFRRYSHALQISMWMSEKMYIVLAPRDLAIRLDLIAKVHGIEEAENYFNNIPMKQRTMQVYGALLSCYAYSKCVEKAENVVQKMRDLGFFWNLLSCNTLLGLYQQTCNYEKMECFIQEMEENQIRFNTFTYGVLISAYSAKSDASKIDEVLKKAESDDVNGRHWSVYVAAAEAYMAAGLMDKAVMSLRNAERFITRNGNKHRAYEFLMTMYAKAGDKDDVLRIWGIYKNKKRVINSGYTSIITSLLRFDDIESAEQVFEEWKSRKLSLDIRIPNFLIGYYCRKGFLEKAEAIIEEMISTGAVFNGMTWYYMTSCYLQVGKSREAVKAMKKSLKLATVSHISKLPYKDVLEACLKFLKDEGNIEEAEEFVGLLEQKDFLSPGMSQRLLQYIRGENPNPNNLFGENEEQ